MRYLTYSELIYINGRVLNDAAIMAGTQKIRDIDLLLAAEQRPQSSAFGADAYPELRDKVAALVHSLARNHPFRDGNKRTAAVAALFMLHVNGCCVEWDERDALTTFVDIAEGRMTWDAFAAWLSVVCDTHAHIEADAEQDAALIEQIVSEHSWLLDELAKR